MVGTTMKALTAIAAVAVISTFSIDKAESATRLTSPYSQERVNVYVGKDGSDNYMKAIYQNASTGWCTVYNIGYGNSLYDDYEIEGGAYSDLMIATTGGHGACGITFSGPISYGGHFLDLYGSGSNDTIYSFLSGDTWVLGENGSDLVLTYNPTGLISGGPDNDAVFSVSSGSGENVLGDDGDDCLNDFNAAAYNFDCGSSISGDRRDTVHSPIGAINCESTVSACPY
jgi:hypothetical protein